MSADSLPYTLLILLVELAVGSLVVTVLFDKRRMVTRGYVQMGAMVVVPTALLALLVAFGVHVRSEIDGYFFATGWFTPFRWTLAAFLVVAAAYMVAAFAGRRDVGLVLGAAGIAVGVAVLVLLAGLVAPPAWSYAGVFTSMVAAALALGGSLMAMSWGHWYLTNSGLPKEPLEQMSLLVVVVVGIQLLLVVVGVVAPVREEPLTESAFGVSLGANPAFWLRVAVGILFPLVLAYLAWKAAAIRGMMSATGLLYIATGAVLAGEVLARGLLFATGNTV
ncbi:MAG: hypothetical protein AB7L91_13435 [Dehalococcoidia bacterium]